MSAGDWKQLFAAEGKGDFEMVEYYISAGIDPNYQHPEFLSTPLIESVQNGHLAVVEYLLHHGANPKIKSDYDGLTALETARLYKQEKVVALLEKY
jgi:ankyrin repeat protein